jgi:hypothetical protein
VLKRISQKQKELNQRGNFARKVACSREINQLYRLSTNSATLTRRREGSPHSHTNKKEKSVPSVGEARSYCKIRDESTFSDRRMYEEVDIAHPFVTENFLTKSIEINQEI